MLGQFHFQQPLWFLALIPLAILLWQFKNKTDNAKSWAGVIDGNLLSFLLQVEDPQSGKTLKWLLGLGWLIGVIALADPVWEKIPRPVFQTNSARVIVLDLSNSMMVNDLKPTRMARARFKVEDILSREEEGQLGLVVFAGDAFTASPLTRDADTIRALLQVLTPALMPTQGSRVDLGLEKAHELLKQASIVNGQVLLITDGASDITKAEDAANSLKADGHTLSILAVGTAQGGVLRLRGNKQVTVKLDVDSLHKITKKGGGVLHTITSNDNDLKAVLTKGFNKANDQQKTDDLKSEEWKSTGPFLVLLLLPLAALAFRKGWLFSLLVSLSFLVGVTHTDPVLAADVVEPSNSKWKMLFQNKEQRAEKALQNKQYEKASELAKDPLRKGSAEYKKGDYQQALEAFQSSKGADARYNEGNTLAKLKKYKEAIKAYQEALKEKPKMADALANKKAIEDFLKKQEQKKSKQDKNKDNKDGKDQKNKDQKQSDKDKENSDKKDQKSKQNKSDSKQDKQGQKGKEGKDKKDGGKGDKKNQFSEANKELDKNKNDDSKKSSKGKGKENKDEKESAKEGDKDKENQKVSDKGRQEKPNNDQQKRNESGTKAEAEELNKEEKMAAEQWLRRIPDDPGGLLRRKFRSQYRQRNRTFTDEKPW